MGLFGVFLFVVDTSVFVIIIGVAFHQITRGTVHTIQAIQVNELASSEIRASIMSLMSSIVSAFYLIFSAVLDWFSADLEQSMFWNLIVYAGLFLMVVGIAVSNNRPHKLGSNEKIT